MTVNAVHRKKLGELIADQPIALAGGSADATITDVADDSRQIVPGALFIARPGTVDDGLKYVAAALERGASAVLAARPIDLPGGVAMLVSDDVRAWTGRLAERFWGEPSKKLGLIGVTGTNGKTTVAYMVRHLLNATGRKCGMMTTVEVDDGSAKPHVAALTTPGSCEISRFLARMVANGCDAAVMECSSHALDQGRCDALDFDVAVFTNLSGDHLDYHQTMEAYAAAKAKLIAMADYALVNADDPWAARMRRAEACSGFCVRARGEPASEAHSAETRDLQAGGTRVCLHLVRSGFEAFCPLVGRHNVYNLIAAAAAAETLGGDPTREAVETLRGAPGRLERVTAADAPFTVLVDYAHTDDALRNVLAALRPLVPDGAALRVLFGCGGDRDRTKRPRMAEAACALADRVVITSDNPRTEAPDQIIADIEAGVPAAKRDRVTTLIDRREAIGHIIGSAEAGDIVLLAGKGHEDYQVIGTTKHPFDDRAVARTALQSTDG